MSKKQKFDVQDIPFLGALTLFVGFALYGIFSFNGMLTGSTSGGYANVLDSDVLADGGIVLADGVLPGAYSSEVSESDEIFTDVLGDHSNATALAYFKQMGYVEGYDDGSFKPEGALNRAELFTVLTNALEIDFSGGVYENCFTDVNSEWFSTYICYAEAEEWVDGYKDGSYKPGQAVVTAEAVKIVLEAFGVAVPDSVSVVSFSDVGVGDWYAPYAATAKSHYIVTGSLFEPAKEVTRAYFVQLVYNAMM